MMLKFYKFVLATMIIAGGVFAQTNAPRIFYFCGSCDQAQMAGTEGEINAVAKKSGSSVIKLGNGTGDYDAWAKSHPNDGPFNLIPIERFGVDPQKDTAATTKKRLMEQILIQLKKMDKTKPIVIHMGNHGENQSAGDPGKGTFICGITDAQGNTNEASCVTYEDFGKLMKEAGLVGPNNPPVRVVGDHCFGGSAHYLSKQFPNVCSASVVGSNTAQNSSESTKYAAGQLNFGSAFWRTKGDQAKSDKSGISLNEAFNSAWSSVPEQKDDSKYIPTGMLSSTFLVNETLGKDVNHMQGDLRLSDLHLMEKSLYQLDDLIFKNQQTKIGKGDGDVSNKPTACITTPPTLNAVFMNDCKLIMDKLGLDKGMNSYKESIDKMSNPVWANEKRKNLEEMKECWVTAQKAYDQATADQKAYADKSRWSGEFTWDFGKTIDDKKAAYSKTKDQEKMDLVNVTLNKCVEKNSAGAREYLVQYTNLKRLKQLEKFANQATDKQKETYRKKVECESAPLL